MLCIQLALRHKW